jgi:hypothetical protein
MYCFVGLQYSATWTCHLVPRPAPAAHDARCDRRESLRKTVSHAAVAYFLLDYQYADPLLTNTGSESMGPVARLWRPLARRLGNVCYLHWTHVHPRLYRPTPQVCHFVSFPRAFLSSQSDGALCTASLVFVSHEVTAGRWALAHTVFVLWHGYANSCNPPSMDHQLQRMETMCHLTPLASGRSALDPLQRSCGRKVRRVAGCRRPCPNPTTLCLSHSCVFDIEQAAKDTSANGYALPAGGRWQVSCSSELGAS